MKILFIHNNLPGQYRRIIKYLKDKPGIEMRGASFATNKNPATIPRTEYTPHRKHRKNTHPALVVTEEAVITGQAVYKAFLPMKKEGWKPDIVLAHSGWGPSMFIKDMFPDTKLLAYFEWYYHTYGSDADFLPGPDKTPDDEMRVRLKNTPFLHDFATMDWGQCPTQFQVSQIPAIFRKHVSVLHDGVDVNYFKPDPIAKLTIGDRTLTQDDEVITFVVRGMDPMRGFPQFMRAMEILQKMRPNLQVIMLGEDRVTYGNKRKDGRSWLTWAREDLGIDWSRFLMMGLQPLKIFRGLMQLSSAHVYLTAPFVLSWSVLEAMSAGALVVGSDTPSVSEIIRDGENGVLFPFFDEEALANKLSHILDNRADYAPLREKARETIVENYATRDLLPRYHRLIEDVAKGTLGVNGKFD